MIFEQNLDNLCIICRGRSLERLPEIIGKFNHCFIVNCFRKEFHVYEDMLTGKTIVQFINADSKSLLKDSMYKRWRIDKALATWTSKHLIPGKGKPNVPVAMRIYPERIKHLELLPDKYYPFCNTIRNSGVLLTLVASEELKPKVLWIIGLDFYSTNYMVMKRRKFQMEEVKHGLVERLRDAFIGVVLSYPDIDYKLATYYQGELPQLRNLEVLR